jgi:hypothetical protein
MEHRIEGLERQNDQLQISLIFFLKAADLALSILINNQEEKT